LDLVGHVLGVSIRWRVWGVASSSLEGISIDSEDALTIAQLIWQWIVAHPMYAKLLVGSLAFFFFSIGIAKIVRAWRVRQ